MARLIYIPARKTSEKGTLTACSSVASEPFGIVFYSIPLTTYNTGLYAKKCLSNHIEVHLVKTIFI